MVPSAGSRPESSSIAAEMYLEHDTIFIVRCGSSDSEVSNEYCLVASGFLILSV